MSINVANDVKNQGGNPSMVQGTFAQRPAAGQTGRLYLSTDTNVLYRDNGSSWDVFLSQTTVPAGLSPIGTAGQLIKVNAGATALEYFTSTYATTGGSQTFTGNNVYTGTNQFKGIKINDLNNTKLMSIVLDDFGAGILSILNNSSVAIVNLSQTGQLGTSVSLFAPNIGVGGDPAGTFACLNIDKTITGATTSYGVNNNGTIQSDVTTAAELFHTIAKTAVASFTLANLRHYQANQGTFGAGSAVTNQYAFVAASSLTGATNNYGFYGNIPSGTNRWNFYANGTAANYFNGTTLIGSATDNSSGAKLQVTGSITFQNTFNRQTASYTLALTDQNDIVEMNVASANNLTVPLNSTVAFPIGTEIAITQYGAGKTTVVATGGVTLRSAGGLLSIGAQYAMVTLLKVGTNEWYVVGNLIA
jgi:hypothetical protein